MEQKHNKEKSLLDVFFDSVQYMIQSIQGKYKLETYLEILSEYTDSQIRNWEKNGFLYIEGELIVTTDKDRKDISFAIYMIFQDADQKRKLKSAEKSVEKYKFTKETIERLETALEMKFEIERPMDKEID